MTTNSTSENWLRGEMFPSRRTTPIGRPTPAMKRLAPAMNPTGWKKPLKFTRESTCPGRGRLPMSWTLATP
jgi:hypothetical protein